MRRITTILSALFLTALLASSASAQLFKDDFTGAPGDTLNGHGYSWLSSFVNPISIVSPGLTYGVYPGSGIGNAAGLKNTGQDLSATMSDSVKSGSLYAAFMVNLSAVQTGDYFFAFSPVSTPSNFTLRLFAKSDSAGGYFLGITKSNESPVKYGTTHYALNTTYLAVLKYSFVAADSNDQCTLFAFDSGTLPETEPGTAEVGPYTATGKADVPGLGLLALRQGNTAQAPTLSIDGIRVDTTWKGVLGIGATAQIVPKSLNFGKINGGTEKVDSVLVRSIGTQTLEITGVTSSDTTFKVSPTTASIAARDSAWFRITFAPPAPGVHTGTVTFHANGTPGSDSVVNVTGEAFKEGFLVTPGSLDFGKVFTDTPTTDTLTVTDNSLTAQLVIDSVVVTNANFTVSPTTATIDTLQSEKFAVTYHPAAAGADSGLVIFYHNAASHQDTVKVKGTGAVKKATLALASHAVDFGRVLINESKADSVKIKNTGELTLDITAMTSRDTTLFKPHLGVSSLPPGDSTYVWIKFQPTTIGAKADTIIFSSNAPEGTDTLFVSGVADTARAMFSLTPHTVAFGSVRAGQEAIDTLSLNNAGELVLRIAEVAHKDTAFHVTLGADTVVSGGNTKVYVQFSSMIVGSHKDTVVFTSNAAEVSDTLYLAANVINVIRIDSARALPNGTEVIVRGIVTRSLGSYTFFQDTTGGMIMYSNAVGAPAHDSVASGYIKEGDLLEVHGMTSEFNALKEIATSGILDFQRISRGNAVPAAKLVTLAELKAHGENYEAQLVTLKKLSFKGAAIGTFANAHTYSIVDSSDTSGAVSFRVQGATDTQLGGLTAPTKTFTYIGPLGQFSSSNPATGYQLLPVDSSDVVADIIEGIAALPTGVPSTFVLSQNFPNPFNPTTTIQYGLPVESRVTIKVYTVLGQEVRTLVNEMQKASYYRVVWDGRNQFSAPLASGIYFCRIVAAPTGTGASQFVQVKKMLMVK